MTAYRSYGAGLGPGKHGFPQRKEVREGGHLVLREPRP